MRYNDREALGHYELWTPASDLRTAWDDEVFTVMLSENGTGGPTKAAIWLTPSAALVLSEELSAWARRFDLSFEINRLENEK